MGENNSKKVLLTVLGVAILVVAVVGISFAIFTFERTSEANTITTGGITMSFAEVSNGIEITDALPMDEATALGDLNNTNEYFDFSVSTTSNNLNVPYTVTITPDANNTLLASQIGINLQKKNDESAYVSVVSNTLISELTPVDASTNLVLLNVSSNTSTGTEKTDEYRLRIWVDKAVDAAAHRDKTYSLKVNVNGGV